VDTSKPVTVQRIIDATDADLETLTTRHLLGLLKRSRNFYPEWEDNDENAERAVTRLKAVLAKRPHVPKRRESKAMRQLAAKRKV
jgi:hypothetical protein